eukprot:jgi/Mesen1/985/ME000012S00524
MGTLASPEDVDDSTLLRFLKARSFNLEKSSKMYIAHVRWRTSYVPKGYITEEEVAHELAAEKTFLQVKEGCRSVMIILGSKHDAYNRDLETFKRCIVHNIDKTIASLPPGDEKFTVLADLSNMAYKNLDSKGMIAVFDFLQAHYPERLGRLFMIHAPYAFWGVWKLVSPFIDKVTKSKIMFVEDKKLEATVTAEVAADMLPAEYGGTGKLVLIQDVHLPGWPPT